MTELDASRPAPPPALTAAPPPPPPLQQDFKVQRYLYKGYASNVFKAVDLASGETVCLKSYSLSKLNAISYHQARGGGAASSTPGPPPAGSCGAGAAVVFGQL